MNERRLHGIVLKSQILGEADRRITLFTRELGKITLIARGISRPSARLVGHLESLSEVVVRVHAGRSGFVLVGVDRSVALPLDELFIFGVKFFLVELVERFFELDDPHPRVFAGLQQAIKLLSEGRDGRVVTAFALLILREAGFSPIFDRCVDCQESHKTFSRFSISEGGVVCDHCHLHDAQPVSTAVLRAFATGKLLTKREEFHELSSLVTSFLSYQLGSELKTRQLLRSLQREKITFAS